MVENYDEIKLRVRIYTCIETKNSEK